ncbi:MAG TPA: tyrosine-type recombinase/integrase [Treponemataceae bacterium]|nr:tyrosine-type recombinase/integrase [Treponemataceae bacterium]
MRRDEDLVAEWVAELIAFGMKEGVAENNRYVVARFVSWLSLVGASLGSLDEELGWAYQGYLLERLNSRTGEKLNQTTVATDMKRIRRFCEWLVKKGYARENPLLAVDSVRAAKNPPFGLLREEELGFLLDALSLWDRESDVRNRMWAYRAHVMAETQYATGLRMSELGNLEERDLDLDRFEIRVRNGKGGKDRVAYLTVYAAQVLRAYLGIRHLVVKGGEKRNRFLFGPAGVNLARAYNHKLNEVALSLGYGRFFNHKFRHELGYHLIRAGCPIRSIQAILGHDKLASTEIYTRVDAEDVREVLDAFHPRSA